MAEFEEKLNAILGDPQAMGQIMALAQSLSGQPEQDAPAPPPSKPDPAPDVARLLGSVDPKLLQMGMKIFQDVQGKDDRNSQLLLALRPFLKEERQAALDRALQLSRVIRLIRAALNAAGGKGDEADV